MAEHTKLLLRIFAQPGAAMSAILDQGSLLYASVVVLAVTLIESFGGGRLSVGFYVPLLVLAIVYVPGVLLLGKLLARFGGGSAEFQRDYAPLLTCTAMAWTAVNLPVALAAFVWPGAAAYLAGAALLYFAVLMFFAVRTVFGTGNGAPVAIVALSWIPLVAAAFLWGPLRFLLRWLASPFFLFYAYYYLGGEIGNLGAGLRRRQHFRRMLEMAAVNPHDGDAQYQLGLIYQKRRQYTEARVRFERAVEIDPSLTDAHFQLGRMARAQGRLKEALAHFQAVVDQDDRHSQSEVLRELGALYLTARQYEDAQQQLADYIERRPYDPEGLYYYGQALEGLGRTVEALAAYERVEEAVRAAPRYRKREVAQWSRMAERRMRKR